MNAANLKLTGRIEQAHENSVFSDCYHPNLPLLLSGGRDAHLKAWRLDDDFTNTYSQPAHWFTVNAIAFHPEAKWLATASRDKTIKIFSKIGSY